VISRLLIIDSHPVQYRVPVYRELARLLAETGRELKVIYGSDSSVRGAMDEGFGQNVAWDEPMLDGYGAEFLPEAQSCKPGGFSAIYGRGIETRIRELKPAAILLNGINYRLFARAILAARRLGIPLWLRSETQDVAFPRAAWKAAVRHVIYRVAYAQFAHFFPIGEANAAHYRHHGVADARMTFARYCVVDRFSGSSDERVARGVAKRRELGVPPDVRLVMFCGKLIPKKNPGVLLEALECLSLGERLRYAVLFVGAGEQEPELRKRAEALSGVRVIFAGFVNQAAIGDLYLASDALALPSRQMGETWGLVANEALMAGKPVILSRHAGSSLDFEGLVGVRVIDPTPTNVAEALKWLVSAPNGELVRNQMTDYTVMAASTSIATQFLRAENCSA